MEKYLDLCKKVIGEGDVQYDSRTQVYRFGISGENTKYDLRNGFPLVTTKNVPIRLPVEELFWKARGERNVKSLVDRKIHIWTANAFDHYVKRNGLRERFPKHTHQWNEGFKEYSERIASDADFAQDAGDLGPVYGFQWRHGHKREEKEVDQLANVMSNMKENPGNAYHVLDAWNPAALQDMALGPCPFWHQFSVYGDKIDLTVAQRSCDVLLGVPFNVAQDATFVQIVANQFGLTARYLNHMTINTHFYVGVDPRWNFWKDPDKVKEFQTKFRQIEKPEDYLDFREGYLQNAPAESPGNERKDHIPFILEQLSKEPRSPPRIEIANKTLFELIEMPADEVVKIHGYDPHRWDAKAAMAA